ncbi:hypothetical protein MRS44_001234 [Fusarium solani]|uniref:uncharacterized protein n=1 Tax=Fusarium solani TaxID=169388 RepID=UPI0032C435AE|nr:hypothetical protein MRS44_001234 [Fusarium solani]
MDASLMEGTSMGLKVWMQQPAVGQPGGRSIMYGDPLMENLHKASNLTFTTRHGMAEADRDKHERGEARLISQRGLHQPPICGHLGAPGLSQPTNQRPEAMPFH